MRWSNLKHGAGRCRCSKQAGNTGPLGLDRVHPGDAGLPCLPRCVCWLMGRIAAAKGGGMGTSRFTRKSSLVLAMPSIEIYPSSLDAAVEMGRQRRATEHGLLMSMGLDDDRGHGKQPWG